jgi:hypothetical protein
MVANHTVRLFHLGVSVILLLGLQLTPAAVTVTAMSTSGTGTVPVTDDEHVNEYNEEDDEYDYDNEYDNDYDNDDDNEYDRADDGDDDDDNDDDGLFNSTGTTCDHGICRDDQDFITRRQHKYGSCEDLRDDCAARAADGNCTSNPTYMHPHCPRTCQTCHNRTLRNIPERRAFSPATKSQYSGTGRRPFKIPIVSVAGTDLGVPQILNEPAQQPNQPPSNQQKQHVLERIAQARDYFENIVMQEDRYESVRTACRNQNEACALWAVAGECEENPAFMREICGPVCFSCQDLHVSAKCPLDPEAANAWSPGDLNNMFERVLTDPTLLEQYQYTPTVLSRPDYVGDDTAETADYQIGPWVLVLDDFVSDEEAERMIHAGDEIGYARSTDVGDVNPDGSFEDVISMWDKPTKLVDRKIWYRRVERPRMRGATNLFARRISWSKR